MSQPYEVRVTKQAQNQMSEIFDYICEELFARDAAIALLNKMEKQILALEESPKRYPLVDKDPFRTEGIRKVIVNKFLVYFWIDEVNQVMQVTAVIYEKRDQVKQLKKMKFDEAFYKQPDLRSSMHNKQEDSEEFDVSKLLKAVQKSPELKNVLKQLLVE